MLLCRLIEIIFVHELFISGNFRCLFLTISDDVIMMSLSHDGHNKK